MKQLLCFILFVACPGFAQNTTTNPYDTLKKSSWFALSGGLADTATPEAYAVAAICQQTNAAAEFRRLLQEKAPAQQLYGLLGLQVLKAAEFKAALPSLLKSEAKVRVLRGCIAGERDVAEVAREIQNNQWRLPASPALPIPARK
jgi:hypothetical protein